MKVALFIVTFRRDIEFFRLCMLSIARHVRGFEEIVVAVPTQDRALFLGVVGMSADGRPVRLVDHFENLQDRGHFAQQFTKCCADIYCPEALWIAHIDADCVFTRDITPADYFRKGKALLLSRPFAHAGDARAWKPGVDFALGIDVPLETMQWAQIIHHCDVYKGVRKIIEKRHCTPFWHFVMTNIDRPFSEFVTLGAMAWDWFSSLYEFVPRDTEAGAALPRFVEQGWSHFGEDPAALHKELERLTAAIG